MNFDIKFYLSIFLRRCHYFFLVASLISAAGIAVATMLPARYVALSLLLVERPQIPIELAASTVQFSPDEQLQIIQNRLTTRAELLEIADKMGIYDNRNGLNPDAIVADMRDRIRIGKLQGSGRKSTSAMTMRVGFSGQDPGLAAAVANELVTRILEENVEIRTDSATQTLEFFQQEVKRLGDELDLKNASILQFKLANQDALPDSLDYRRARQASQQERVNQVLRDVSALKERRQNLTLLFERTGSIGALPTANLTPEQEELEALKREQENALLIYSAQNPRVKVLASRIAALEEVVARQSGLSTGEAEDLPSPLEIQLADIDGQVNILNEEREYLEIELDSLKQTIQATPGNSIRLGELERDLLATQELYQTTVRSLSSAQLGERIEILSKGQRISVVEPAIAPRSPVSPNRPVIAVASVGVGVLMGLGVVVLLELMNSALRRPVEITQKLGITPLGTLPYVRTRRQNVTRRLILVSALIFVVFLGPAVIWFLHTTYLPVDLLVERALQKTGLDGVIQTLTGEIG
ncbi:MAG: GNVR domain-containing protein [Litoreibacter sp.]